MKKLTATVLALSLLFPTAAFAQQSHSDNRDRDTSHVEKQHKQQPRANEHKKGAKFERSRASHYQVIDYRSHKNLRQPPKGYRWVRDGSDALLIRTSNGIVSAVVSRMFR